MIFINKIIHEAEVCSPKTFFCSVLIRWLKTVLWRICFEIFDNLVFVPAFEMGEDINYYIVFNIHIIW